MCGVGQKGGREVKSARRQEGMLALLVCSPLSILFHIAKVKVGGGCLGIAGSSLKVCGKMKCLFFLFSCPACPCPRHAKLFLSQSLVPAMVVEVQRHGNGVGTRMQVKQMPGR